jgi:hypothetical protein
MCPHCGGIGLIWINWADYEGPREIAVCLCSKGLQLRSTKNAGKETGVAAWQVWAYGQGLDPERIYMLEDVLSPEDLQARGFGAVAAPADREAALLAASKAKKGPKL